MGFERIASGCYLEALGVDGDVVWYSDVVLGGVHRLAAGGDTQEFRGSERWIGGLLLNEDGAVIFSGACINWIKPETGESGVLLNEADDLPLPGVNELTPDGHGGLYFGTLDLAAVTRGEKPASAALYHLSAERRLSKLYEGLVFANGLGVSPNGDRLFLNESFIGVFSFEIGEDGRLGEKTLVLEKPDCDGMAIDALGNLWVSGFASPELLNISPDGEVLGRLRAPADAVTNVRFGGVGNRDLYITCVSARAARALARGALPTEHDSWLLRTRVDTPGLALRRPCFTF